MRRRSPAFYKGSEKASRRGRFVDFRPFLFSGRRPDPRAHPERGASPSEVRATGPGVPGGLIRGRGCPWSHRKCRRARGVSGPDTVPGRAASSEERGRHDAGAARGAPVRGAVRAARARGSEAMHTCGVGVRLQSEEGVGERRGRPRNPAESCGPGRAPAPGSSHLPRPPPGRQGPPRRFDGGANIWGRAGV